jgi:aminopeptidase
MTSGFGVPRHKAIDQGDAKVTSEGAANDDEQDTFDLLTLDGVEIKKAVLTAKNNWTYTFEGLNKFKDGKVIEVLAKDDKDKKILENLISVDNGASHLGEVALVPFDSPINETGILFYNTLYDENACCHVALGESFVECIRNYDKLNKDEISKINLNHSVIHVDFMIGSSDLKIEAITYNGKNITIFENGTWAI